MSSGTNINEKFIKEDWTENNFASVWEIILIFGNYIQRWSKTINNLNQGSWKPD
jgi:GH24 family phage-related lysozyme (muramidase)